MSMHAIVDQVIPKLVAARVERVTLTGGEPFVHPYFMDICAEIRAAGLPLGICTNATQTSPDQIDALSRLGDVHINVSFDGFRPETHGKFRGDRSSFDLTLNTTRTFAAAGLLQGLLSTPNALTQPNEFADLCEFAVSIGAAYVLMNPLSSFGRGVKSKGRLAAADDEMRAIHEVTTRFANDLDVVHIRFPNDDKPLGGCDVGKLIYVFTDGATAVCPYLVFAARTEASQYADSEFLIGNIFTDDVAAGLDAYDFHQRYTVGDNPKCSSCAMNSDCGKGCPAAIVTNGGRIGDVDSEQCPIPDDAIQLPLRVAA